MPYVEGGRFHPSSDKGETMVVKKSDGEDGETIEDQTILSAQESLILRHTHRHNPLFDSDFIETDINIHEPGEPNRHIEVAYWLRENLSTSLSYRHKVTRVIGSTAYVVPEATLNFFPIGEDIDIEMCSADYAENGNIERFELDLHTTSTLNNYNIQPKEQVTASVSIVDTERASQTLIVDGDEPLETEMWGIGHMMEITDNVRWRIIPNGNCIYVFVKVEGEHPYQEEFVFPKKMKPEEVEKLLLQDKPLSGIYIKQQQEANPVE